MDVSSPDNQLSWLEAVGLTVDKFLLTRPLTYLKQTKYSKVSANNRTKYEYRHCRCGCGCKLTLCLPDDYNVFYKESAFLKSIMTQRRAQTILGLIRKQLKQSKNYL